MNDTAVWRFVDWFWGDRTWPTTLARTALKIFVVLILTAAFHELVLVRLAVIPSDGEIAAIHGIEDGSEGGLTTGLGASADPRLVAFREPDAAPLRRALDESRVDR